ncbi:MULTISPECIES: DNA-processing protein DprA [unclassified Sphingobium]|uniref:DNA-processing protein DprA n=1 Tax=unclassified Sphingobium TaxID=2611147 RepID=UPI000D1733CC|nr:MULTISPECIES: DNA-processing protein DprA [unclassified Sphingobium]MBG6116696.1 DNA processing protein [Sphingobium sp. JAI105]PSO12995.1 DNA-protecting protein DprA [Sphingobium sp. AEW4]TWD07116.1 DNA processing protein [Sphingobium sp. AEW010]TWD24435.1 DNA processing protein [Sphingobium sp. AEW013]TWD26266.1 DNA processing protein [Sphingobium sp. AEW001]
MSEQERFDRLRLIRSPRIGPVSYRQLLARFGTAGVALRAIPDLAARGGGKASVADAGAVEREIAASRALGARYLLMGDAEYPALLDQFEGAPPALIVRGDAALAAGQCIAMVGARNASAAAIRFARTLAQDLGQRGAVVVSGLARGIDTAAHQGSVGSGTIGVIACGLDVVFPPENRDLQAQIADVGLLVTEHPPGVQPLARHFPARNRIIAGLAVGTVVVEAAPKSGSLITARLAGEAGREVMAVPGSPLDPRAQGCNQLIREGATLIQNADDVLEAVGSIDIRMVRQGSFDFAGEPVSSDVAAGERSAVIALLGHAPVPVDELIRLSGLSPAVVQTVLLELELAERLDRLAGGRVRLR